MIDKNSKKVESKATYASQNQKYDAQIKIYAPQTGFYNPQKEKR
ncbi:hypothetical protein [Heyndrickxia sporothermodurans]|nr:hypothetical protein [Heyndrickxia sporothermodurans]